MMVKIRDENVRTVVMKLLGGPLDDKLLLYIIDFEFDGTITVPIYKNKIPTGAAAVYEQMMGVDEKHLLMEFVGLVKAPPSIFFEDPEELDQEILL